MKHGELVHEYSLSPELLAMSHVWHGDEQEHHMVAAKGAPEAIIDLCHLPEAQAASIAQVAADMADQGLRVLGVARAELKPGQDSGLHSSMTSSSRSSACSACRTRCVRM